MLTLFGVIAFPFALIIIAKRARRNRAVWFALASVISSLVMFASYIGFFDTRAFRVWALWLFFNAASVIAVFCLPDLSKKNTEVTLPMPLPPDPKNKGS